MRPTDSDISRDFGMRSTSAKCDLTAASSPLSQATAIATAADHHRHTTSGPVKQNQQLQPRRAHLAPSHLEKWTGITGPFQCLVLRLMLMSPNRSHRNSAIHVNAEMCCKNTKELGSMQTPYCKRNFGWHVCVLSTRMHPTNLSRNLLTSFLTMISTHHHKITTPLVYTFMIGTNHHQDSTSGFLYNFLYYLTSPQKLPKAYLGPKAICSATLNLLFSSVAILTQAQTSL